MSANPTKLFTAYAGRAKVSEVERAKTERRSRARIGVHWPVRLFRTNPPETLETITQNLSSCGFYCHAEIPLAVGEVMSCTIRIPAHDPSGKEIDRLLDCTVRITRVEAAGGEGIFGIACQLEDYHVVRT